jgi:hypothetical protein
MRNRAHRVRRRAVLAAAGLLAAGALTGCKAGGMPFAYAGVARGDVGCVPASPALAHAAAGQHMDLKFVPGAPTTILPSCPGVPGGDGMTMTASPGAPMASAPLPPGPPVVGSGGLVYPVGSAPTTGQVTPASAPGPSLPSPGMSTVAAPAPAVMPFQSVPTMVAQSGASLPTYNPSAVGQQMILLVNGPNGPQYVIAEVMGSAPAPVPAMPMPVTPAASTMPAAPTAMNTPMTPATFATAPEPLPAPTFTAPPPAAIPMPALPPAPAPAVVPVDMGAKAPDAKPPAGPVLPASGTSAPSLGSFPPPPAPGQFRAAKLPAATGVTDDDIPAAPAFVPAPK